MCVLNLTFVGLYSWSWEAPTVFINWYKLCKSLVMLHILVFSLFAMLAVTVGENRHCPDRRRRPLLKPAHFPGFPPGGDVGPHQKLVSPKPMEMLRSPVRGDDTPDGEALPPGLCVLSDQQEECRSCLHSHFSFPTQRPLWLSASCALGISGAGAVGWDGVSVTGSGPSDRFW